MSRSYYSGPAEFLIPDGTPVPASCDAGFRQGRWTGTIALLNSERRLERGDVCQLTLPDERRPAESRMRVIITDQVGSSRYAFIALIKPDPYETL